MADDLANLMTIGTLAARCGLTVSALRFYDRGGVLVPASVDPVTGYRRYAARQVADAVLLASLRRIGLPVNELRVALELRDDVEALDALLTEHVRRLEHAVEAARGEVARIHARRTVSQFSATLEGPVVREALGRVRFAASDDPAYAVLAGVRLTIDEASSLVATDRFRLASAPLTVRRRRGSGSVVLPVELADRILADDCAELTIEVSGEQIALRGQRIDICTTAVPGEYPDVEVILPDEAKLAGMIQRPASPTARLDLDLDLGEVQVNDEFLLDALGAAGENAVLHLDGHLAPLVVLGDDGYVNLIMPIRPEAPQV